MVMLSRILDLHTSFRISRSKLENSMTRIASGDRFSAIEDAPPYGDIGVSERLRFNIKTGEQSRLSIQNGMSYLNQADSYADTIVDIITRMMEVAAASLNPTLLAGERAPLDVEYQELREEITSFTRSGMFYNKQTVGRDAAVTFDTVNNQIRFYTAEGGVPGEIIREFDSDALDSNTNFIGYSSDRDYTMSRDARSLYYMGETALGSGVYALNKYDVNAEVVKTSFDNGETYDSTDKLFVDEEARLFVADANTLYELNTASLAQTATGVLDLAEDTEFSVYKGIVTYLNTSDEIVTYDLNTSTPGVTPLIADTTTVVAGQAAVFAAGGVDHSISASGEYIADEVSAGVIRIMNTRTGTGSFVTVNAGTANAVTDLQISEDSDRVYFLDQTSNSLRYVSFETEGGSDDVIISSPFTVAQGTNQLRYDGLSMGGANYDSIITFALKQDSLTIMEYEAGDLRQYQLGLLNTRIDTAANADTALDALVTAQDRANAERAKLGAMGGRLRHTLNTQLQYLADAREADHLIRDVDIAREATVLTQLQVSNAASMSMISQFNTLAQSVLKLISR